MQRNRAYVEGAVTEIDYSKEQTRRVDEERYNEQKKKCPNIFVAAQFISPYTSQQGDPLEPPRQGGAKQVGL